jgi:pimeloyl-ACP methyl ester carboxylesterase
MVLGHLIRATLLGLVVTLTTFVYRRLFITELAQTTKRLQDGSHLCETPFGPIEYAVQGDGPTVLVLHGIWGGYDHGLVVTMLATELPLQVIAVSRPGYLRTALKVGATPEAEADAYAALLDALSIKKVAVVGMSAGGPAALQFALRHPRRCWALVMLSAVSHDFVPTVDRIHLLLARLLNIDFIMWVARNLFDELLMAVSGLTPEVKARIAEHPQKLAATRALLLPFPVGTRKAGFYRDLQQFARIPSYDLSKVRLPTLVVHGTSDFAVPLQHGQFIAEHVPNARMLAVHEAGHFAAITHKEEVLPQVTEFLLNNMPAEEPVQYLPRDTVRGSVATIG